MSLTKTVFDVLQKKGSIHFTFSSTLGNVDDVCEQALAYLRSRMKCIGSLLFAVNLVTREGLTNAVRHGNSGDPGKLVKFKLSLENSESIIKIVIEDQGGGFDWQKQQSVAALDEDDHGRGIKIMETYFNRYSYNAKGNILYLEKNVHPDI